MLRAMTVLLACQLAGEIIARSFDLPIPGPVLGMLALFGMLLRRGAPAWLDDNGQGLLRFLPLLFVPAGVGIMSYAELMRDEWIVIAATLLISTIATMLATAGAFLLFARLAAGRRGAHDPEQRG